MSDEEKAGVERQLDDPEANQIWVSDEEHEVDQEAWDAALDRVIRGD